MRWLMPVAAAKLVPGTRVQAAIHPGTDRLYLSGSQLEVWPVDTGGYRWQEEALGLRVVDLEQLETLQHIKLALSNVVVTPNGRYAIVTGAPMQSSQRGQEAAKDEYGLYLFEADSLKLLSSVRFDGWFQIDEFVFDDFSYVQFGTELDSGKWITTLQVRALPSLAVVAERTLEDGYAALIGLGHPRP